MRGLGGNKHGDGNAGRGPVRRRFSTSSPCRPGRCRSRSIRSGTSRVATSRPTWPDVTDRNRMPGLVFMNRVTTSMFAGLSSMYRTRMLCAAESSGALRGTGIALSSARARSMSGDRGSVRVKVVPSPGTLAATRCPCIASAKARARGRPIPVPSTAVCSAPSRSNGSKMRLDQRLIFPARYRRPSGWPGRDSPPGR